MAQFCQYLCHYLLKVLGIANIFSNNLIIIIVIHEDLNDLQFTEEETERIQLTRFISYQIFAMTMLQR